MQKICGDRPTIQEQRAKLLARYYIVREGRTLEQVARELGLSRGQVIYNLYKILPQADPELFEQVKEHARINKVKTGTDNLLRVREKRLKTCLFEDSLDEPVESARVGLLDAEQESEELPSAVKSQAEGSMMIVIIDPLRGSVEVINESKSLCLEWLKYLDDLRARRNGNVD